MSAWSIFNVINKMFLQSSFPRRRESTSPPVLVDGWVPAFAGMTSIILDTYKFMFGLKFTRCVKIKDPVCNMSV